MLKPSLVAMSLFTFLASCFGGRKQPEKAPAQPYQRFPETDVTGVRFEHIELQDGFDMKTFFIAPDKRHLYALAYKAFGERIPDDPRQPKRIDARIFELDSKGKVLRHLELKDMDDSWGSSMGLIGNELMVYSGDYFIVINTSTLEIAEKIPVWHEQHFQTKEDIELMTRDEYIPAYMKVFDAAMEKCTDCHWLVWPSGKCFVYVAGPMGKRTLWTPLTYAEDDIAPYRDRFPAMSPSMNPAADTTAGGAEFTVTDGTVRLHEEDVLDGGQELDYPNYKFRSIVQYGLTMGARTLHFSTTDQKRHDARIGFSDNRHLTTADGAVWVRYMGWLYRIE